MEDKVLFFCCSLLKIQKTSKPKSNTILNPIHNPKTNPNHDVQNIVTKYFLKF